MHRLEGATARTPFARVHRPLRAADADLVDLFFVSAVATLLLIRAYLEAAGYPRLGGGGLHIAHVLWGGLGMLAAILLLLLFASPTARRLGALAGGVGFGAFIDELGKFLTSDNNYFFKPTAALVYVVFVALFFAIREVRRLRPLNQQERLIGALALSEKLAIGSLIPAERDQALALLATANQADPMVADVESWFRSADLRAAGASRLAAWRQRAGAIVANRWFARVIAAFFVVDAIVLVLTILVVTTLLAGRTAGDEEASTALAELAGENALSFWIEMIATLIAAGLMLRGVLALRRSRALAYRAFERAVLVDLFLAQPLHFLAFGFLAALGVFLDLLLLAALRSLETRYIGAAAPPIAAPRPAQEPPVDISAPPPNTIDAPVAAQIVRRTVDLQGLAEPFRFLARAGYACIAALLLVTLVAKPLGGIWPAVEFTSSNGIVRTPAAIGVVGGIALVLGWAFLLTGAAYFRLRVFVLVACVFLLVMLIQGSAGSVLVLAIGAFALWAHFRGRHLAGWRRLPLIEFAAWSAAGVIVAAPAWFGPADQQSAAGLALSFEVVVLLAVPFWLLLGVEVSEMAVTAGRWVVAAAQPRVGEHQGALTAAILLAPPLLSLGLLSNERWSAMFWDVAAALVLLVIGAVALVRRRLSSDTRRALQVLSVAALVLAWSLSIGLGGPRNEPQDPVEWLLGWTALPPIFLFILALSFNVLSFGARYCNGDSALMPRQGRVLAYFGFAILLAGGLLMLANSRDAAGNPPDTVKALTTPIAALGVLFISYPYLGWMLVRRRERLLREGA